MKNTKDKIWLALLLLEPIVLWLLPSDFFDNTGIEICPSKLFFNFECLGCGMTRAVMHFHHFEFSDAIFFNYGVVAIYPALVVVWFIWVKKAATRLGLWKTGKTSEPV
ncbi:MAG: DUF2752 domain-containing protein [Saprospiraceae bacterium]|nr:DUF2752 domain-containing protein [Saprospiraceae bacterium]MCF8250719.1 DUF2752 domain-containing protein [Saprospiraceae bacterium]MCF8279775.1 DUF2752 domain-containing protein [Bacteroidales bacterium]MCF8310519.1 DUF2752 domain-containing protein [Saprospiraceae bacterium]MCF8440849.1 DUF2752 domain-containing protein [Saprospiraceae bacterium]